jgi:hypothetical protein
VPPLSFIAVEVVAFTMGALLLREAWMRGLHQLVLLIVSMLFGFAIEVFFVTVYSGYSYGDFLVDLPMFGHTVPLWVAVGWGTIIWGSMQATDRMGLPWGARPALDSLLAVSLDFGLDPIAEALGWWHWSRPGQFFEVPFDNFIGWMMIVGFYSLFVRSGFQLLKPGVWWKDVLVPVVALIPAALSVAGCQWLLEQVYPVLGEPLTFFILATLLLILSVVFAWGAPVKQEHPWFLFGLPAAYHGLTVILLLAAGVSTEQPELLLVLPLAALVSLFAFNPPGVSDADAQAREA